MGFVKRERRVWQLRSRELLLGERTLVMGVLNVTPDSFSDGGAFLVPEKAMEHGLTLLEAGADILDIGGESTRPGSNPLTAEEEQARVLPVITGLSALRPEAVLSVDTWHSETARAAVNAGAEIVNDVSGFLWDPAMARACAELECGVILMHTRGRPAEWPTLPSIPRGEVVSLVQRELAERFGEAQAAGVSSRRILLDPGYGFGKRGEENFELLAHQAELLRLGRPLLAAMSRKAFLGKPLEKQYGRVPSPAERDIVTVAAHTAAILAGASVIRVHAVKEAVEAARVADEVLHR